MDPIHPILPQPPNIPPVLPSTGVGRVDRDGGRGAKGDREARAKAQQRRPQLSGDAAGEDEGGPHVDITA